MVSICHAQIDGKSRYRLCDPIICWPIKVYLKLAYS